MPEQDRPIHPDDVKYVNRRNFLEFSLRLSTISSALTCLTATGVLIYKTVEPYFTKRQANRSREAIIHGGIIFTAGFAGMAFDDIKESVIRNTQQELEKSEASRRDVSGETHDPTEIN